MIKIIIFLTACLIKCVLDPYSYMGDGETIFIRPVSNSSRPMLVVDLAAQQHRDYC